MNPFNTKEDAEAILAYTGCKLTKQNVKLKELQIKKGHHDSDAIVASLVVAGFYARNKIPPATKESPY